MAQTDLPDILLCVLYDPHPHAFLYQRSLPEEISMLDWMKTILAGNVLVQSLVYLMGGRKLMQMLPITISSMWLP